MKKIFIIIISIFLLTQNNDYRELNDLTIVSSIIIDYQNNNYNLYLQTKNPKNNDNFTIYNTNNSSLKKAFTNVLTKSPNTPYYKHLETIYLTDNIKINNFKEIINYFIKNNITRNEFYIITIPNNNINNIINVASSDIKKLIKNNYKIEPTFDNILNNYLNPNKTISIPKITYINKSINLTKKIIQKEQ